MAMHFYETNPVNLSLLKEVQDDVGVPANAVAVALTSVVRNWMQIANEQTMTIIARGPAASQKRHRLEAISRK